MTVEEILKRDFPELAEKLWRLHAHKHQQEPQGDWTTWLILGGRGAGKTRAGAEWVRAIATAANDNADGAAAQCIALVAETYADAREVMIEGPSGIRAVAAEDSRPVYEASRRRLVWPSGAVAYAFSAEDPDGIRGYQFTGAWSDELCKWRYAEETWSNLQLALRLGDKPRQIATTTPRPSALIKRLMAAATTEVSRATTYDNRAHLSDAFFTEIAALYEGTALGRQELLGEVIDDVAGALWNWNLIEAARVTAAPALDRCVVAVDPPATSGPDADECGIIIAGVASCGDDMTAFVLADWSAAGLSPRQWAEKTAAAYHEFEADRIVVEVNQGGDMAKAVIAQVDPSAPVRGVHATRGKRLRAEPVAALYERTRVRHVGAFPKLEDQMVTYAGEGGKSPDRLDALVWALTDLMLKNPAPKPGVKRLN
ncbi:terminase family protein [Hyphococcus flavus]|uniref:Terminase family protein n=1 Tax=Hyphococcus flavus TaxID=1866326 RepID=A0AAE9ZDW3_9PROT|nr:terminase family protein [Hyphococcus flavus]WDI33234.1 terminase family protein [Hyphococcus flavus]